MTQQPWSNNQLKRLSRSIRDGTAEPNGVPSYAEVMLWYNDVAVDVLTRIREMDWSPLLGARPIELGSRAKTLDTLRQKLVRDQNTPLPSVQDVAGIRFEAEMSLDEQDAVAGAVAGMFNHGTDVIRDLRLEPHSGYRAVHVWLRLPVRVEVQIRTHMQGEWANTYEAAADVIGRDIRYGQMPTRGTERDVVEALRNISVATIADAERERNGLERELLRLRELGIGGVPIFDRQVEDRLRSQRADRLTSDQQIRDQLRRIHDQFRTMQRRA